MVDASKFESVIIEKCWESIKVTVRVLEDTGNVVSMSAFIPKSELLELIKEA